MDIFLAEVTISLFSESIYDIELGPEILGSSVGDADAGEAVVNSQVLLAVVQQKRIRG